MSEESYSSAEGKLNTLSAIVTDIAPHLIEARLEKEQIEDIIKDGGTAYTQGTPIPISVLEAMPLDVAAYARAFMAPPREPSDTEGYSWNVFNGP